MSWMAARRTNAVTYLWNPHSASVRVNKMTVSAVAISSHVVIMGRTHARSQNIVPVRYQSSRPSLVEILEMDQLLTRIDLK